LGSLKLLDGGNWGYFVKYIYIYIFLSFIEKATKNNKEEEGLRCNKIVLIDF
jgi:hypothetical protein